jgi:hypothetical protein
VGWRFGGARLAATLAFAWAAWPFSQYASSSNTNDMIQPALLIFGFYFLSSPWLRGAFGALGALVKFAPLIVLPLWSAYPDSRDGRSRRRFVFGALVAAAASFVILLFDSNPLHGAEVFVHHTFGYQFDFHRSRLDCQHHAKGIPDLHWVQRSSWYRRRRARSPLAEAALAPDRRGHRALLVGFDGADALVHPTAVVLPVRRLRRPRAPHRRSSGSRH